MRFLVLLWVKVLLLVMQKALLDNLSTCRTSSPPAAGLGGRLGDGGAARQGQRPTRTAGDPAADTAGCAGAHRAHELIV